MENQRPEDPVQEQLERLTEQMADLSRRLGELERARTASGQPSPPPPPPIMPPRPMVPPTPSVPPSTKVPPLSAERPAVPGPLPLEVRQPGQQQPPAFDWEQLIGGKWALWLGSLASFIAVAFFLAYAWQYLGPAGRLMIGFGSGLLFLGAGALATGRGERWFSEGLSGAGLAIFYLSTWAGAERYGVFGPGFAFLLMAAITGFGVFLAVRSDAVSLCVLSTLGGFLTPAILTTAGGGAGSAVPLLTYIAVLDAGILMVSLFKRWRGVVLLSFIATVLLTGGWALQSYTEPQRWAVFAFFSLYFLMFLGAACFYSLVRKQNTAPEDLVLLFADSFVYLAAGDALMHGGLGNYPGLFPAALGVFLLLLAWDTLSAAPANAPLRRSLLGLGLTCLTLSIPVQMRQGWIAIAWSIEAAVLATLSWQFKSITLRRAGQAVWLAACCAVLIVLLSIEPSRRAVLVNERALPLLVGALASGWIFMVARRGEEEGRDELLDIYALGAVFGGAALVPLETSYALRWRGYVLPDEMAARTLYTTAFVWAAFSLVVWRAGVALESVTVRLSAITLAVFAGVFPAGASTVYTGAGWQPFWNARWLTFVLVALLLSLLAWMVAREREALTQAESDAPGAMPALVSLVVLWAMTVELYAGAPIWGISRPLPVDAVGLLMVAMFWAVYAPVLLALGAAWKQLPLRVIGYLAGFVALLLALTTAMTALEASLRPVANLRFLTFAVLAASALAMALIAAREADGRRGTFDAASATGLLAAVVLLWGLTQETYEFFRYTHTRWGEHWQLAAQMGVSLVWSLSGVLFLIGGVVRRYRPVRLFALFLLGLTAVKVFFADLSFLDTPYRILSFAGLGLALIGISWLYSHYEIGHDGAGPDDGPTDQAATST